MKKNLFYLLISSLATLQVAAQVPTLAPSIGQFSAPSASDSVCPIQTYLDPNGTYLNPGLSNGQLIPDFTLYDRSGNALNMQSKLASGKPVLIISGSYTCPVFRNKVNLINNLKNTYANSLDIFIVYAVEAHPTDTSPYFGYVNVGSANTSAGILYAQPKTYGQRVALVDTMLAKMNITVPVYIDGPCNNWWNTFGPAPNNAYLITTQGKVFVKHGWFNKAPMHNIQYDIDSLLSTGGGGSNPNNGTFTFQMVGDSIVSGPVSSTLYAYSTVYNNSANPVLIDVIRADNNVPFDWATSICTDVCLPPHIDSTQLYLAPGDTQSFTMYFYTGPTADSGHTRMIFRNINDVTNVVEQRYFANSTLNTGIETKATQAIHIYPNPAQGSVNFSFDAKYLNQNLRVDLFDTSGKALQTLIPRGTNFTFLVKDPGIVFYRIYANDLLISAGSFINTSK